MRDRSPAWSAPIRRQTASSALGLALLTACPARPTDDEPTKVTGQSGAPATTPARDGGGPEFVVAPESGEVSEVVRAELERADADDRVLLVYVGASWCEPCLHFHAAVDDGRLDAALPDLRLLEFDLDHDHERLLAAGYQSKMIPLFVAPAPDGRAGPRRTEGGIKGPGAVDNIRPRVEALMRAAAADRQ